MTKLHLYSKTSISLLMYISMAFYLENTKVICGVNTKKQYIKLQGIINLCKSLCLSETWTNGDLNNRRQTGS